MSEIFTSSSAPPLKTGAQNLAGCLLPPTSWAGVETKARAVFAGGEGQKSRARAGGVSNSDDYIAAVQEYNTDTSIISTDTLAPLSDSREYMQVASLLNTVIFAGGNDEKGVSNVVEYYTSSGKHQVITPLSVARTDMAAASVNGNVLFAGGDNGAGAVNTIDVYQSNFTQRLAAINLPKAVKGLAGCSFGDYAVFAGGRDILGIPSSQIVAFDKYLNRITSIPELSVPRYNLAMAVAQNPMRAEQRYLFVAGGKTSHSGFETTIDVYDSAFNKIDVNLKLTKGRSRLVGAGVGGYVLFAGGVEGVEPNDQPSAVVDIFNYKLQYVGSMTLSEARNNLAVSVLGNSVLFAGGYGVNGVSTTVDDFKLIGSETLTVTYYWDTATVKYLWG